MKTLIYEIQYIQININSISASSLCSSHRKRKYISSASHENDKKRMRKHNIDAYSNIIGTPKHEMRKKQISSYSKEKRKNNESSVLRFQKQIQEGPYYICVVCNRCLYRRSVVLFAEQKYPVIEEEFFYFATVSSFDSRQYICHTCHKKLKKQKIPCQAVCNKLQHFEFPNEISHLRKLEKVIISKRLLFKKIVIMPKGQTPKLKGAICNVPLQADNVCHILPRGADSNGIVMVKLKRKLTYV